MHYGKLIEDANEAGLLDKNMRDLSVNFLEAFKGSPSSIKNIFDIIRSMPCKFRDGIFFLNLNKFLTGLELDDERQEFLREVLSDENGTYVNTRRLLQCIERIETETKIDYIVNATLALLDKKIDVEDYFRIVNAITNTLDEDLKYLKSQVLEGNKLRTNLSYSYEVQGLLSSGLMYQTSVTWNSMQGYYFTKLGVLVDMYALSYGDSEKYRDFNIDDVRMQSTLMIKSI